MFELHCLCVWTEACQLGKWHKSNKLWVGCIWIFSYSGVQWDLISHADLHQCLCFIRTVWYSFGGFSWRRCYSHSCKTRPQRKFSRFLTKSVPRAIEDGLRITLMEWKSPQTRRGALFLLRLCHMGIFLRLFVIKNAMTLNSLELVNHQKLYIESTNKAAKQRSNTKGHCTPEELQQCLHMPTVIARQPKFLVSKSANWSSGLGRCHPTSNYYGFTLSELMFWTGRVWQAAADVGRLSLSQSQ